MRYFFLIFLFFFLLNCSFDNKSGIWTDQSNNQKKTEIFKNFEKISISEPQFKKIILADNDLIFKLTKPKINYQWNDVFYQENNNFDNFNYSDLNKRIFKSSKISRKKISNHILLENNNLITNDQNGTIIVFSIDENKIKATFNFYKKNFKNTIKRLNLIIKQKIIYVSDNFGYVYAFDYEKEKVLWAKNFKIPFRSNIKIVKDKVILSDQNNNLYFLNKIDGNLLKLIPTEETIIKNQFINNLSINSNNNLFFLNSYGSLYSINIKTMQILWFININKSFDTNYANLFSGSSIINEKNFLLVSSNKNTYLVDANSGFIQHKYNFSSAIKPLINNNYIFIITKNNLLLSIDINTGKIIFSHDINNEVSNYLDAKKFELEFKDIVLLNNKIYVFLMNSHILKFKTNGKLEDIKKLPFKINTSPIFIDSSILYLDSKNEILIFN